MSTSGQMPPGQTQPGAERRIDRLLAAYGDSHSNLVNKMIHWICVPVIYWCALAFLSALPFPSDWRIVGGLDWAVVSAILASLYYLSLSVPLALGMTVFSIVCLGATAIVERASDVPIWQVALFVFVFAWVLQFIGHRIERRQPSFLQDVQFLLIGPAWLLAAIYRLVGVRY